MDGFIDIHCHVAWGMDDGPATQKASLRMMQAAYEDGVSGIIATPHVRPGIVEFDYPGLLRKVDALNDYNDEHQLGITVYPGSEIMYTDKATQLLADRKIPTLANSEYVLVEFRPEVEYQRIYEAMRSLTNGGFTPILAHAERYACLVAKPKLIDELKKTFYIRVQLNCSTILDERGRQMRKFITQMMKKRLVDYVATDSHNTSSRPTCLDECFDYIADVFSQSFAEMVTNNREILMHRQNAAQQ